MPRPLLESVTAVDSLLPRAGGRAKSELLTGLGKALRALRVRKGYSLDRLARASQVSRAMLSQIELAQSAPTITVLWRIANALGVPFSALLGSEDKPRATLMRAAEAVHLQSAGGGLKSRPLFPLGNGPRRTEFYELTLAPHSEEHSLPHPQGTGENLVVSRGQVSVEVGSTRYALGPGDALQFQADVEHIYRNSGDAEAHLFLVMTYELELS